jgi:hypothetical protein
VNFLLDGPPPWALPAATLLQWLEHVSLEPILDDVETPP